MYRCDRFSKATGTNGINVNKNGSYIDISGRVQPWTGNPVSSGYFILDLVATDYIELKMYQQSGSPANALSTSFTAQFLGA
jgi:hypothetical protein